MAATKSKKTTAKTKTNVKKSLNLFGSIRGRSKKSVAEPLKKWLMISVVVNLLLGVVVLRLASNPTEFTDASAGFTVDIPAGWTRQDQFEVFRITEGADDDPRAQIFAYGQRGATLGFYDGSQEERDSTLDLVTEQINGGQNQFILSRFELTELSFSAQRGQKDDGTEFIRSHFTGKDATGQAVEGEHLLLVSRGGGVYSIIGYADAGYWPQVQDEINQTIDTYTAP